MGLELMVIGVCYVAILGLSKDLRGCMGGSYLV